MYFKGLAYFNINKVPYSINPLPISPLHVRGPLRMRRGYVLLAKHRHRRQHRRAIPNVMAQPIEHCQDAITAEEMAGATAIPSTTLTEQEVPRKNNACIILPSPFLRCRGLNLLTTIAVTTLMSPKKVKQPPASSPEVAPKDSATTTTTFLGRAGLGAYIASPESFPASRVISYSEKFVVINDLYPKSSVHLLLLSRDPAKTHLHPFDALEDKDILAEVQSEVSKLRTLVAKELRRRYGRFSVQDKAREQALEADSLPSEEQLPLGRDWSKEVVSGVHAHPSMNHLHIHILSVDRESDCMRHRKHYNSFATPFLVPIADFPLPPNDRRRHPGREGYLHSDLKCWKCGKNFGNKFARLKNHLAEEFEIWKRE